MRVTLSDYYTTGREPLQRRSPGKPGWGIKIFEAAARDLESGIIAITTGHRAKAKKSLLRRSFRLEWEFGMKYQRPSTRDQQNRKGPASVTQSPFKKSCSNYFYFF